MAFKLTTQLSLSGPSNADIDAVLNRLRTRLGRFSLEITPRITASNLRGMRAVIQGALARPITIPLIITRRSARDARIQIDNYLHRPFPIQLNVTRRSLAGMWTQIRDYFLGRPVPIAVTTGNVVNRNNNNRQQNLGGVAGFGQQLGRSLQHYGTFTAATGGFIQLFGAIRTAIDEAIEFDRELVRVSQVTGTTTSGLADLSAKITEVSTKYGTSSNDILKASVTLAQAGLSAKETKEALEALAKTSVSATFGDIADTTEAAIAIMQQFGYQTKDLDRIFSSINKVSAAFAVESEDITVAVRRAGGAFQAAGGTLEEFLALFTSVRQTTRESAETISTGFRTIFARLQRNRTQNFFKSLGIDLLNDKGLFVGPYEAIKKISEALKGVDSAKPQFAQIVEELGGFRQVSKVIPLLQQTAVAERALNIARRGGNSLTDDANRAQESLAIQLKRVHEEFVSLVRDIIGSQLFKDLTRGALEFTRAIVGVIKSIAPLAHILVGVAGANVFSKLPALGRGFGSAFNRNGGGLTGGVAGTASALVSNPLAVTAGSAVLQGFISSLTDGKTAIDKFIGGLTSAALQVAAFRFAVDTARPLTNTSAIRQSAFGQIGFEKILRDRGIGSGKLGRQAITRGLVNTAFIGGAASSAFGGQVSEGAFAKINTGKNATGQAALGGALTYGGIGAGFGAILGPLGAAVFGTTGALFGFTTELYNSTETLKSVNIAKEFEELAIRIQKVNTGKLDANSQVSFVRSGILKQAAKIFELSDTTKRSDAISRFKSDQAQIEVFFGNIAKDSKSFEDFMDKVGNSVSVFSALSNIPFKEISDVVKKQIDIQNKSIEQQEKLSDIYESEIQHRIKIIELAAVFNASFANISGIEVSLQQLQNAVSGGAVNSTNRFNAKSIFSQAVSGEFADSSLINTIAKNIGENFGNAARVPVSDVTQISGVLQRLPELLIRTRTQKQLSGEDGDFIDKFLNNLGEVPDFVKRSLSAGLEKIRGNEAKDENIIDKIEQDLSGAIGTLTTGLRPLFDTFGSFAEKITEHSDTIDKALSLYEKVQFELIKVDQKRRDVSRDYSDFIDSLTGNRVGLSTVSSRRGTDLNARFGSSNVSTLSSIRIRANDELKVLDDKVNAEFGNIKVVDALKKQMSELRIEAERAGNGLETVAYDSDNYVGTLRNLIEQTRKENEARTKLASTLVFGNKQEQRQSGKDIFNSAIAAKFGIGAVAQDDRRGVESFLEQFGSAEVFGKKANELLRDIRIDGLSKFVGKDKAAELVDNKPASVQELLNELNDATAKQQAALDAISTGLNNDGGSLISAVNRGSENIVKKLEELIQKQEQDKKDIEVGEINSLRDTLQKQKTGFNLLQGSIGSTSVTSGKELLGLDNKRKELFKSLAQTRILKDDFLPQDIGARNRELAKEFRQLDSEGRIAKLSGIQTRVQEAIPSFKFSDDLFANIVDNSLSTPEISRAIAEAIFNEQKRINTDLDVNKKGFSELGLTNTDSLIRKSLSETIPQLNQLAAAIELIGNATKESIKATESDVNRREGLLGRARGGIVPGFGNSDSVPAVLTPGEFVLNKKAVERIGVSELYGMNATGYASGGEVRRRKNDSITASIIAFQRRLAQRESNFAKKEASLKSIANKNVSTFGSLGDSQALRNIKKNTYNSAMAVGSSGRFGPKLTYGSGYVDEEAVAIEQARRDKVKSDFAAGKYSKSIPNVANFDRIQPGFRPTAPSNVIGPQSVDYNRSDDFVARTSKNRALPTKTGVKPSTSNLPSNSGNANFASVSESLNRFASNDTIKKLAEGLLAFPKEITFQASHKVEVIFNGAEIMTSLLPEVQKIALNTAKEELNKFANKIGAVEHAPALDSKNGARV